ncbi:MAG TPA: penicillin-binding transpeptidase domain-containing protein [Anaerolineaceae bacterium]|nr:penicillin-binding transpeptidase domain-containing protein [Anaerolineaceae bacterium]
MHSQFNPVQSALHPGKERNSLKWLAAFILLVILLNACRPAQPGPTQPAGPSSTAPVTHPVQVKKTQTPDTESAVHTFLDAWKKGDPGTMYGILSMASQGTITVDDFAKAYSDAADSLTLSSLDYTINNHTTNPTTAESTYSVVLHTNLFGDLHRDYHMDLVLENRDWRINWDSSLILPELKGGNRLDLAISVQPRGKILDKNGDVMVSEENAYALGVDPGEIGDNEHTILTQLSDLTGKLPEWIKALYENSAPQYIPVGEALASDVKARSETIRSLYPAVMNTPYSGRYYQNGGIAPHVTGYAQLIPKEKLESYLRKGYLPNEMVGVSGLEQWGEDYLRGKPYAVLTVVDPAGNPVSQIGEVAGVPPQNITTTIDWKLQKAAQNSLMNFRGAIVVLERDTGRVLALASSPGFDPNLFQADNFNRGYALNQVFDANTTPLVDRATTGSGFPLGSVFKIITMSAALESGVFTTSSTYTCPYEWDELGVPLYDWTYDKKVRASSDLFPPNGLLTLPQGLMRSCNIWFYHIGLDLYRDVGPKAVTDIARGFGLGSPTGIGQIDEIAGSMPDPQSEDEAVQMAIGQGKMQVTPLQVARFVAAVGNNGTLYRPQVVESIAPEGGQPTYTFKTEAQGKLPVKPENLKAVQDAMRSVVNNPKGTAFNVFAGFTFPIYGKTGTAQNSGGTPHAWFAGYTDAKREGLPDLAIAVLAENAGEGSDIAAPIFRRMIEVYFYGHPLRLFKWEGGKYYVTRTPTPSVTDTPAHPEATETPKP